MQCHKCGSQVPQGMHFCQECGTPVSAPPPPPIAPTVAVDQPPYGAPGSNADYNASSLPPTVAVDQPSYGTPGPYTNYNASGGDQPYGAAPNPYANTPYGQPQSGNVPPPPSNVPPYNPPPQGNAGSFGAVGAPPFASPPPVKRKSKVGLIVGIVIAVLLVVCVGSTVLVTRLSHTNTGSQVGLTPAATPTPTTPSGNPIDPTASAIVTNIQMASAVNSDTAQPTTLATSFRTGADIYTTFQFDFRSTNVTQQNPGYVRAKYYIQDRHVLTDKPLKVDDSVAPDGRGYGYFTVTYDRATTAGAVELYWCRQISCSDEKLAATTTFTVY